MLKAHFWEKNKNVNNKVAITTCLAIITLNVDVLNVSIERHRVYKWVRKQHPYICYL